MNQPFLQPGQAAVRKIAILRALQVGDLLVAVPALRAIRAALPDAEIVLIGLPWAREFVARFPHLLDGFREFPGWPGLPERVPQLEIIPQFLTQMQAERYDLIVQLHGSGPIVNELCMLCDARRTAGFYLPGDYCPDPELFLPWPAHGLELRRLLALTHYLGFPSHDENLEFPIHRADIEQANDLIQAEVGGFACIHPGASVPLRRWPVERFAAVADTLAARGLRIVLTGTGAEYELTQAVMRAMSAPAVDLAGKTTLGSMAALIARAQLLVCNDTSVSHIAAAIRTPSVVISTEDNPERWSPVDRARHRVCARPRGWPDKSEVIGHAIKLLAAFSTNSTFATIQREGASCGQSAY